MSNPHPNITLPPDLYSRNTVIALLTGQLTTKLKPKILDVGGYNGGLASFFPEAGRFVILDKKPKPPGETAEYMQSDAVKIAFSDRNFDMVISSDLMEHVKQNYREQVIKEMLRVSKNFLILGCPLNSRLVHSAEDQIRSQYFDNAGVEHPFLIEHEEMGLPEEQSMDSLLDGIGVKYMKVREGNLMNWYLQQLYTGTQHGEIDSFSKYGFYTFFNEHLFELGNLRSPTYRTIYVIAKEGVLPESEINAELAAKFTWNTETFMSLMRIAFDDIRFVVNRKKDELAGLEGLLREADGKFNEMVGKARKSVELYRQAIQELRNFLQEKEQALNLMKGIIAEKEARVTALEKERSDQESFIKLLVRQLDDKQADADKLRGHVARSEQNLVQSRGDLAAKDADYKAIKHQFDSHAASLKEIRNSRAWKAVMFYSKIKMGLFMNPAKQVKKGARILVQLGPKIFMQRLARKIRRAAASGHAKDAAATNLSGYEKFIAETALTSSDVSRMKKESENFEFKPVISIVMPVYNIEGHWLDKAVKSVQKQAYQRWELCMCDDASTVAHIKPMLIKYAAEDKRIKVTFRNVNGGIVKASNDALKMATGGYVGLLDNDDELSSDALYETVKALQEKKYDLIYSDEDKLEIGGQRSEPFFKPSWSPDLLLSCNYVSHFGVYRRKILNDIGGFREGFDGSQDYDLVLRFTEKTQEVKHIPKILYHWRKIPGSTAATADAKPYAFESGKRALQDALKRRKIEAEVADGTWLGSYRVIRKLQQKPLVSIIIPFKDKKDILETCLRSIFAKTTYEKYEIILVNNRSELLETAEYLEEMAKDPRVNVQNYDAPFNFSAINNFAVKKAKGEMLILLNNDTEVIAENWIEAMLEHAQRGEVGAVGAKLLYPNKTVQHAGVVIGLGGLAGHAFSRALDIDPGYFGQSSVTRNYSAVTAACMMMRRDVFEKIGGFDEQNLAVAFNDVDLCLRLREAGYLIVYTPYALLFHHESLSRGFDINLKEVQYMQRKYAGLLSSGDPYYNINLTQERGDFSLRCLDKVVS
jgi:GT2 family glycosyltransferase